jgi:hypothetical protein
MSHDRSGLENESKSPYQIHHPLPLLMIGLQKRPARKSLISSKETAYCTSANFLRSEPKSLFITRLSASKGIWSCGFRRRRLLISRASRQCLESVRFCFRHPKDPIAFKPPRRRQYSAGEDVERCQTGAGGYPEALYNASIFNYCNYKKEGTGAYYFDRYFTHFHPYMPILDPSLHPDQYYADSHTLFWSITAVASRRYDDDPGLMMNLAPKVYKLPLKTLFAPLIPISTIKGVLLLLTWCFPPSERFDEIPYALTSAIFHASMKIGLHVPDEAHDFYPFALSPGEQECERRYRLWVHVYISYLR